MPVELLRRPDWIAGKRHDSLIYCYHFLSYYQICRSDEEKGKRNTRIICPLLFQPERGLL